MDQKKTLSQWDGGTDIATCPDSYGIRNRSPVPREKYREKIHEIG